MAAPEEPFNWHRTSVLARVAEYVVAGPQDGETVVFVHGWALSHRSYQGALRRLVSAGTRVIAPALPGFGGTAPLAPAELSMVGYARWLAAFLDALEVTRPVTLIGHSFGGGVALQTAHDHPGLAGKLVLVNSVGGSVWKEDRLMRDRPLWDWGIHLSAGAALSPRRLVRVLPVVAADAVSNAVARPRVLWEVGRLARDANLEQELATLRRRRLPIYILWGREDRVIPLASAEALAGTGRGRARILTVSGDHNWLISDPNRFVEVLTNVVGGVDAGGSAVGL